MALVASIKQIAYAYLLCRALGHRWIPEEGEYIVIGGHKAIRWYLFCENGCKSHAQDLLFKNGQRVPGSQRRYKVSPAYKDTRGWMKYEYKAELFRRKYTGRIRRLRAG